MSLTPFFSLLSSLLPLHAALGFFRFLPRRSPRISSSFFLGSALAAFRLLMRKILKDLKRLAGPKITKNSSH